MVQNVGMYEQLFATIRTWSHIYFTDSHKVSDILILILLIP